MTGTTLCPRCGAPIPWDGASKTVHCSYCNVMVTPVAAGAPRHMPVRVAPGGSGGGLGVGCAIAGIVGLFVLVGGGAGAWLMLRGAAPSPASMTISAPTDIATPAITVAAKPAKPAALTMWGEAGNGAGQLTDARSITVDMDENVYVADYDTLRVQKFDTTGKFQWIAQVPKDDFAGNKQIWGLAVDSKNVLWVNRSAALFKYSLDGKLVGQIKGNYDDKAFKYVGVDAVGNLATLHTLAGDTDLLLLDPNGKVRKRVKNVPEHGLAMDGAGNVYLSDEFGGSIQVIDPQGVVKSKFGSSKDKHTSRVGAIAVDGKNHIFAETGEGLDVFDQGGGFIKTIDTSTIAGLRSFAISSKGHLFVLGNDKVAELEIGALP